MNQIDFTKMPIVDAVNEIIIMSVEKRASDIHFDPSEQFLKIRIRVDGVLVTFATLPNSIKQNIITRIKLLSGMNITETRLPQDGAIKTVLKGHNLDLRVSSLPTKKGEKIVIRILDYSMSIKGIEYLYFSEINYKKILKMIGKPNGIILVTGATGSGKSTTVYSFLQRLNVEGVNLVTVEDPVEMDIEGINQVQVNSDIGLDFAAVLRSILRQDPNVIMIGEIRDSETAQIAVRASITGHLVLSTIHTNNSLNTIERLLDMEVERYLLASALEGIISQTLARKLCNKCKKLRPTTNYEKQLFKTFIHQDIAQVYEAGDCPECNAGYQGRIALQEVLLINQEIRDAISEGVNKEQLRNLVYNSDVITMLQDGLYKVVAGFTTIEEVLKLVEIDSDFNEITNSNNNQQQQTINQTPQQQTINQNSQPNNQITYESNNSINDGISMIKKGLADKAQANNTITQPTPQANNTISQTATQENTNQTQQPTNIMSKSNLMPNLNNNTQQQQEQQPNSIIKNGFDMKNNFVTMDLKKETNQ